VRGPALIGPLLLLALTGAPGGTRAVTDPPPGRSHRVYFADTDHELNVYHIRGREEGPTLLIIGGMHGNEPGGYLAADLYADLTLRRGNLIVVPRANIFGIHRDEREAGGGDLNRRFGREQADQHEIDQEIVGILTELMSSSDAVLNLHDGSGWYDSRWVNALRNPQGWGQTVIVDTDLLPDRAGGEPFPLEEVARDITERANRGIADPDHYFRVKNTWTFKPDSPHQEQRGSATFFAVSRLGIPAFGVETSKDIPEEARRVEYQVLVINAFLDRFGIVPDHPRFALETPQLAYLAVSVDGAAPVVIDTGGELRVPPGVTVEVTHVEANYERGLVVDLEGVGGFNDGRTPLKLSRDTRISVWKDKYQCGSVWIRLDPAARRPAAAPPVATAGVSALRLTWNGRPLLLEPGATLQVLRGDSLTVGDPLGLPPRGAYQVNFRGFVGNTVTNDGEDRGYIIHTEHDLLQRFSLSPDTERYEVRVESGTLIQATALVEVVDPRLAWLLLRLDGGPLLALADGDTLAVPRRSVLTVADLVTRPAAAGGFTVNFVGFPGPSGAEDRGHPVRLDRDLLPSYSLEGQGRFYEITVRRSGMTVGRVVIDLRPDGSTP
jgi:hypothetical protein